MGKTERWILPTLFLIMPFAMIAPGLIWKTHQLFFIAFVPLLVLTASLKNVWVKTFLYYNAAWVMGLFLYYLTVPNGPGPANGLTMSVSLLAGVVVYKFVSEGKMELSTWYSILRIAVIIQLIVGFLQVLGYNPVVQFYSLFLKVRENLPGHMVGTLGNRNYLAAFVAFTLPMFIVWRRGIFLPVIAISMIFAPSPASLAMITGAAFYFAYKRWGTPGKITITILGSVAISAAFTATYVLITGHHVNEFQELPNQLHEFFTTGKVVQDQFRGDLGRFGMWLTVASNMIHSVPGMILGFGPGTYWGRDYPLHSTYVMVWFYYGLIGLLILFGYICNTWRAVWKSKNAVLITSFLIICVESTGNHTFEIATTGMLGVIIMGLIERERLKWLII